MSIAREIIGIVLVKNEDIYIERVLLNIINFCDKIIITDNCSTDDTSEIIQRIVSKHPKIEYHLIKDLSISHDLISTYAGKNVWIFAVDGDEIYDPAGLVEFRRDLLAGEYDKWWMVFGNVLNCIELNTENQFCRGHLAPPCRSMTKLYNFNLIESWKSSSGERLHGGDICFKIGFDKTLRCNLHETTVWEQAKLRCLHVCFLQRSSSQKMKNGLFLPRPNPADIMSRSVWQRLYAFSKRLLGIPEEGKAEWKVDKFTRGEIVEKKVSGFFPPA